MIAAVGVALGLALWGLGSVAAARFARARWGSPWLGALPMLILLAVDALALMASGDVGFVLDALAPGQALLRLASGSLDARALLTLGVAPALTVCAAAWVGAESGSEARRNAALRTLLAPLAVMSVLAAVWPTPMGGTAATDIEGGRTMTGAVVFRGFVGGALNAEEREGVRRLRDLLSEVRHIGGTPVAVEWSDPVRDDVARAAAARMGLAERPAIAAMAVQNLERSAVLDPIPTASAQPGAILGVLHELSGAETPVDVWAFGEEALAAEIAGATVRTLDPSEYDATIARADAGDGPRNEVVVVTAPESLSPDEAWFVDQFAMAGGSVGLFAGAEDTVITSLVGVWGVGVQGASPKGSGTVTEPFAAAVFPAQIPAGASLLGGPDALIQPVLGEAAGPVLIAVSGTVPSAMAASERPPLRTQSRGTLRALVGSADVLRANPGLLRASAQWLLDRPTLPATAAPPDGTRTRSVLMAMAGLLVVLLGGLVLGGRR